MNRCKGCTNACLLTINKFSGGRQFVSGNRCERGLGLEKNKENIPNLFDYKLKRTFNYYKPLQITEAKRGKVGIPRVLNMYENYPFWYTFFTELGYQVVLSPVSSRKIYELGIESIPSESECYPAKLAHGHISWLIKKEVPYIFYPCIPYEHREDKGAGNHYNCPIVTSYGENIKNNVDELKTMDIVYENPFFSFESKDIITEGLLRHFLAKGMTEEEITSASHKAWDEMMNYKDDIRKKGEETLEYLEETGRTGIVLAGRPYHIDPEIHHGIPDMITSYGVAVLTEDSISHLGNVDRPMIVVDQWMYHTRLYNAAAFVRTKENLELIQLNSFGCGLDAVTTDGVADILTASNKIYTCLKIDEVNSLGAARIRVRSLLSAMKDRKKNNVKTEIKSAAHNRVIFTEEMRDTGYTILAPQMSPIHFQFLEPALHSEGYNVVVLDNDGRQSVDVGLKYVNNDACYPSLCVVGQIMDALLSGKYDLNRTAVLITQTGGGCRATNYIGFIRRALKKAGMEQIPVVSINASGLESNPGLKYTYGLIKKILQSLIYGDVLMRCLYRVRPYELTKGSANELHDKWVKLLSEDLKKGSWRKFNKNIKAIINDFDTFPIDENLKKPRVGIVGEILVKYAPAANNYLVDLLEAEGAEAVCPDLIDFFMYTCYDAMYKADYLGKSKKEAKYNKLAIKIIDFCRKTARKEFAKSKRFTHMADIYELAKLAEPIVSIGNMTGEGWFLTAEMIELINTGTPNIVCCQPFACLPNHIVGNGVIKELRLRYPKSNIVAIDYDPGASEVNQLNRIKLMLSTANKNMEA